MITTATDYIYAAQEVLHPNSELLADFAATVRNSKKPVDHTARRFVESGRKALSLSLTPQAKDALAEMDLLIAAIRPLQ